MPSRFASDTAIALVGPDRYSASMQREWWIVRGPNGGYVAAVLLRAMTAAVDDDGRHPRSLTVHFTAPPAQGPVEVHTTVEKRGRSMTTVTARMLQGDRVCALAIGAFSGVWPGPEAHDRSMPMVPAVEDCGVGMRVPFPGELPEHAPPLVAQYDARWAVWGAPDTPGGAATAGGWIRFADPEVVDAPAAAALTDAWIPPIFAKFGQPMAVPTVDLTVHFRTVLPLEGAGADDWVLAMFRTTVVREGFLEEDGELWSPDGRLLAQSRQLAVAMPLPLPTQ